jgi:hypothetical protein
MHATSSRRTGSQPMSTSGFISIKADAALFVSVLQEQPDGSLSTIVTLPVEFEGSAVSTATASWDSQGTMSITF